MGANAKAKRLTFLIPVTHTCNHSAQHQFVGTGSECLSHADWLATRPCIHCICVQAVGDAVLSNFDLPRLTGSKVEIEWAEVVRASWREQIEKKRDELFTEFSQYQNLPKSVTEAAEEAVSECQARLQEWTKARVWIEARDEAAGLTVDRALDVKLAPFLAQHRPVTTKKVTPSRKQSSSQ